MICAALRFDLSISVCAYVHIPLFFVCAVDKSGDWAAKHLQMGQRQMQSDK